VEALEPGTRGRIEQVALGLLRQVQIVHGVPLGELGPEADVEPVSGVGAHGLQQPVPRASVRLIVELHHRRRDEPGERQRDVGRPAADRGRRGEVELTREDGQPREQRLVLGVEQRMPPLQRRREAPVTRIRGARRGLQQREPVVEPVDEFPQGQRRRASGSQLDRERQPVEPATELTDERCGGSRNRRSRSSGCGAVPEQAHSGAGRCLLSARALRRDVEGTHGVDALSRDAERLAARREHAERGRGGEQGLDEGRAL
jgi:hypothetical protein